MSEIKRWFAENTNPERAQRRPQRGDRGMRRVHRRSPGPGLLEPESLGKMAKDPIVFAMANPTPEVMPEDAEPYVRIMATGRSDYPNQINNVLCFPGVFRGALDAGAPRITEEMKLAAARGIAEVVTDDDLSEDYVIPSVFNRDVAPDRRPRRGRGGEERGPRPLLGRDRHLRDGRPLGRRRLGRRRRGRRRRHPDRLKRRGSRRRHGGLRPQPRRRLHQHPRRPEEAERPDQGHRGRERRVQQLVGVRDDVGGDRGDPEGDGADQVEGRRAPRRAPAAPRPRSRPARWRRGSRPSRSRRATRPAGPRGHRSRADRHPGEGRDVEEQRAGELDQRPRRPRCPRPARSAAARRRPW